MSDATTREWCQYRTPDAVAQALVAMVPTFAATRPLRVLDPGAGDGVLGFMLVERLMLEQPALCVDLTLVEAEPKMRERLAARVEAEHARWGGCLRCEVVATDFLAWSPLAHFDVVVCNPPYGKISPEVERGGKAPNIYARFVEHSMHQLRVGGAGCFIVPRSYMNGAYFADFRDALYWLGALVRVHQFESRRIFDDVLQEVVLVHYVRTEHVGVEAVVYGEVAPSVLVSYSQDADGARSAEPLALPRSVVEHGGVWLPSSEHQAKIVERGHAEPTRLHSLRFMVSTGKVIPFRVTEHLRDAAGSSTVPLLRPQHVRAGQVTWPATAPLAKPEHISRTATKLLVPTANYVLVRRMSTKEDARRVVAAPLLAGQLDTDLLGIENHLNLIYRLGLTEVEARELAEYLNSDEVDLYVRAGNGNTQVNAAELLALPMVRGPWVPR